MIRVRQGINLKIKGEDQFFLVYDDPDFDDTILVKVEPKLSSRKEGRRTIYDLSYVPVYLEAHHHLPRLNKSELKLVSEKIHEFTDELPF